MNQRDRIKQYLDDGLTLNRLEGWSTLGILETPARICEIRAEGYPVTTKMITVTNRYGEKVRIAQWTKGQTQKTPPKQG